MHAGPGPPTGSSQAEVKSGCVARPSAGYALGGRRIKCGRVRGYIAGRFAPDPAILTEPNVPASPKATHNDLFGRYRAYGFTSSLRSSSARRDASPVQRSLARVRITFQSRATSKLNDEGSAAGALCCE